MLGNLKPVQRLTAACRSFTRTGAVAVFACLAMAASALSASFLIAPEPVRAEGTVSSTMAQSTMAKHLGVASCAGSTCHGHSVADGHPVRQDELKLWQEESSPGGAHSRAYRAVLEPRGQGIVRRLGLDAAGVQRECLGCHASPGGHKLSDGVDCETCHGAAGGWISSHYTVGASYRRDVSNGMTDLVNPRTRARVCLDCHLSGDGQGQFIYHRIMAAGHPRISFELDLFSTLQQHWNEDADYVQRKGGKTNSMRMWAVGQAEAVNRSLELFSEPAKGMDGIFPEFTFYDCHSCHRRIYDGDEAHVTAIPNPGRPIHLGMPPYNDENMIMLIAASRVVAPDLAGTFEARSKAFHAAMGKGRREAVTAAQALRQSANALADRFSGATFSKAQTFAIMDSIASNAITPRFTDYEGAVQSVMAIDTLLNGMVNQGMVSQGAAGDLRVRINEAYAAVRDPNGFQPIAFRRALTDAVSSIRSLR
ncbi:multiheme c-type cytochrome [Novosphingobium sp. ZN18A2]|uniref:multiheme c-type cytochrome n=1 Tax=Novosphingobium sp. ZN18A2 TaxID=3079861 RepID=UPI0030CBECF5